MTNPYVIHLNKKWNKERKGKVMRQKFNPTQIYNKHLTLHKTKQKWRLEGNTKVKIITMSKFEFSFI